jgi:YHS domain-containing protein
MGVRRPGKAEFAIKHKGRLYLFPSQQERDAFEAHPDKYTAADLAYGGLCPVCLLEGKKRVRGQRTLVSVYDGLRYLSADANAKARFDANPARYAPALDGLCVVCLKEGGQRMHGSIDYGAYYNGRIYLLADEAARNKFLDKPSAYADVDLAASGNCVVCEALAGKRVRGTREHVSIFKGMRYLFPSSKERETFDSDPPRFALPNGQDSAGRRRASQANSVAVVGRTACAGCAYGKRPLADPDSLGIAVVTADKVYIVERGEQLFPDIFADRFDGLKVKLTGTIKRAEGKFVWVDPQELTRAR